MTTRVIGLGTVLVSAACFESLGPQMPLFLDGISAGAEHTCGVAQDGAVLCWGQGEDGQLGNGAAIMSVEPVEVSGGYVAVGAGGGHTCALTAEGAAWCWGANGRGQLGAGAFGPSPTPVPVTGEQRFRSVSAGAEHTCAIAAGGRAWCWGANDHGQLGDGSVQDRTEPVRVAGGHRFASLAAGTSHTCGLTRDGVALCWGWNEFGQLGNDSTDSASQPELVEGGHTFTAIAVGLLHTCATVSDDSAYCWGSNPNGELGVGSFGRADAPGRVQPARSHGNHNYTAIAAGDHFTCAVDRGRQTWCWGRAGLGQIGNDGFTDAAVRQAVEHKHDFGIRVITAGARHACSLTPQGEAHCWGDGESGQLGRPLPWSGLPLRVFSDR